MGRADQPKGEFLDKNDNDMREGNGSILMPTINKKWNENAVGPSNSGVYVDVKG